MCIKIPIELLNLFSQNSICQKWGWIIESYSKHSYWVYVYQNWYWIIEKFWTECMCIKITIELLNPTSRIVSVKNRVELLNHIQNIHIGYMCKSDFTQTRTIISAIVNWQVYNDYWRLQHGHCYFNTLLIWIYIINWWN